MNPQTVPGQDAFAPRDKSHEADSSEERRLGFGDASQRQGEQAQQIWRSDGSLADVLISYEDGNMVYFFIVLYAKGARSGSTNCRFASQVSNLSRV